MSDTIEVRDNEAAHRYEATVDGVLAILEYERSNSKLTLLHTDVPDALSGRGVGSALAKFALDDVRGRDMRVIPLCPFVRSYIERHPEYQDIMFGS